MMAKTAILGIPAFLYLSYMVADVGVNAVRSKLLWDLARSATCRYMSVSRRIVHNSLIVFVASINQQIDNNEGFMA